MSPVVNSGREALRTLDEISLAGLILEPIRAMPASASYIASGRVTFHLRNLWYELFPAILFQDKKDFVAIVSHKKSSLLSCTGIRQEIEPGIWRISG